MADVEGGWLVSLSVKSASYHAEFRMLCISLSAVVLGYGGDRPEQTLLAGRYLLR